MRTLIQIKSFILYLKLKKDKCNVRNIVPKDTEFKKKEKEAEDLKNLLIKTLKELEELENENDSLKKIAKEAELNEYKKKNCKYVGLTIGEYCIGY